MTTTLFWGGLRAAAQFISYEIPRTLSVVGVVVVAGTLSTVRIMEVQTIPYAVLLPVGFVVYPVSYTHLRAHETKANLVCRLLLEKKKKKKKTNKSTKKSHT